MTRHRYIVYGWPHYAAGETSVVGTYLTRTTARLAAWWYRLGRRDAHAWAEGPGDYSWAS